MPQNEPGPTPRNELPSYDYAVDKLHQLQGNLSVTTRTLAMDELNAAVAHQLNDPLTALLFHLHEIEQASEQPPAPDAPAKPVWETVGKAVREAERVCDILERVRHSAATPVDSHSAIARGREAIDAVTRRAGRNGNGASTPSAPPPFDLHPVTPREREVLAQIVAGASNKEGSQRLGISPRTFEVHRAHLMRKLGARNAADLVRTALSHLK